YLNNIVEQDHRAIKRRVNASLGFRSFDGAQRTIQGYEAMHMIRKGQVRWLEKGDVNEQVRFISITFGLAAYPDTRKKVQVHTHPAICKTSIRSGPWSI